MATAERDYYELLGVERAATEAELKKAFRRKARELHPDVSDEPDAQERFRQVAEAYEVLSNAETRQLYDRFGHAGLKRGGFTPTGFDLGNLSDLFAAFFGDVLFGGAGQRRAARGGDVGVAVEIELTEAATGVERTVEVELAVTCAPCGGSGAAPGTETVVCADCGGSGALRQVSRSLFGEFVRTQPCGRCDATGRVAETPCDACDGVGRTLERRELEVEIPAGIHDGQQIRLRGRGHAGANGAAPGDAYVQVRVRPHPELVRDGDDIVAPVRLTIAQAALGVTIAVPTLDGETEVEFRPGTQPGEVHVLRGRGMPVVRGSRRGDQRLLVDVVVPRRLDDEQRRLLEQLESSLGEDAYRQDDDDEGFFERLKSAFR
jgi:molecular chaperone DnaJ